MTTFLTFPKISDENKTIKSKSFFGVFTGLKKQREMQNAFSFVVIIKWAFDIYGC